MQFIDIHKQKSKSIINITSLIDVMFLLLIFFMVSATFKAQSGIKLDLPKANSTQKETEDEINIEIDADGNFYLDGNTASIEHIEKILQNVENPTTKTVILRADRTTSHGKVVEIMDIIKEQGIKKLIIATKNSSQ